MLPDSPLPPNRAARHDGANQHARRMAAVTGLASFAGPASAFAAAGITGHALGALPFAVAVAASGAAAAAVYFQARKLAARVTQGQPETGARASTDPSALLEDRIRTAFSRARRHEGSVSVLALSIDQFEEVYNGLGEAVAGALEREALARIAQVVREDEMVLQMSGNHFMAVVGHENDSVADAIAARIQSAFEAILSLGGERIAATVSIGIAADPNAASQPGGLVRAAEIALAEARAAGGNTIVRYSHGLDDIAHARTAIARDLRKAVAQARELALVFQPIYARDGETITGTEVLLRWNHQIHGRLSAPFLIALAEDSGLLDRLSLWIVERGLELGETAHLSSVTFNLSSEQLRAARIVDHLCDTIREHSGKTPAIEIDFPLSALESAHTREALMRLGAEGAMLCLDGLGDAPLAACDRLIAWRAEAGVSAGKVKIGIDTFPDLMLNTARQADLFQIAARLRVAGLLVAAKNVETSGQTERLQALGFEALQGRGLCSPVTGTTMIRLAVNTDTPHAQAI